MLAGATGLEPATSAVTGQRSNQLSYAPVKGERKVGNPLPRVNCGVAARQGCELTQKESYRGRGEMV
jgi:hypothetical protein